MITLRKPNNIQFNHLVELNIKIKKGIQSAEDDMILDIYRKNKDMVTIQLDNKGGNSMSDINRYKNGSCTRKSLFFST